MKVIGYGPIEGDVNNKALRVINAPSPLATGLDLLVRVKAVALNPVDAKIRSRVSPPAGQHQVLGWDAVGIIEAVGESVQGFKPGQEVWYAGAVDRPGCQSELHLVDSRIASLKPRNITFPEAAAMPLTSITAWELLFDRFGLGADTSGYLLVIGAAGGVGSMMIQLAKQLTNLTVVATASRPETRAWVQQLGADLVIDHQQSLSDELSKLNIDAVPYIASLTHTEHHLNDIANIIAPQGKLGVIDDPSALDILPFKRKSVSVHWEFMFTRPLFGTDDICQQQVILQKVAQLVEEGRLQSTLQKNLGPMTPDLITDALQQIENGTSLGKLVLEGWNS